MQVVLFIGRRDRRGKIVSAGGDLGEGGASGRWGEKADGVEQMHHASRTQGGTRVRGIEGSAKNSDRAGALSANFPDKRLMGIL